MANTIYEEELKKAAAANGGYKGTGTYNDAGLSAEDKAKVDALGTQWKTATAAGDTALADQYHQQAEAIRSQYGYSGGKDGSEYQPLQQQNGYYINKTALPSYEAQTGAANNVYDAAKDAVMAQLQTAYDNNRIEAEAAKAKIPGIYNQQANAVAADAAIQQRNFNEQAAASGLNTGTGSQARLSQNNALMGNLSAVRQAQAEAEKDMETQLLQLYTNYQNSITEALANNEYERAAALLSEYQKAAASAVDVAQVQAGLDMETAGFNRDTQALELEWAKKYGSGVQPSITPDTDPTTVIDSNSYGNDYAKLYGNKHSNAYSAVQNIFEMGKANGWDLDRIKREAAYALGQYSEADLNENGVNDILHSFGLF